MALCPFHNDRHPSLYVADDHYYCFACGEHGDVIDFVGRLFQLSPYDAARKLMADFHLSPDKPPSAAALHAKRIRTEAQQLMENERLCFSVLSDYARVLRDWKVRYAPQSPDKPVHARFMEACHKLDETEYYLDILCVRRFPRTRRGSAAADGGRQTGQAAAALRENSQGGNRRWI
ncbi:MAG: CHC2 zinc finger domain-containing protein [Oscillospiraceae bacterium]